MNIKRIAFLVARELFTSGGGGNIIADRLALMKAGRDLGGWGFKPAIDRIEKIIRDEIKAQTKKPKRSRVGSG